MKIVENSPFCIELVIYKKKLRLANRCTSARKDRQVENKICEHNFCELELRERWISGAADLTRSCWLFFGAVPSGTPHAKILCLSLVDCHSDRQKIQADVLGRLAHCTPTQSEEGHVTRWAPSGNIFIAAVRR